MLSDEQLGQLASKSYRDASERISQQTFRALKGLVQDKSVKAKHRDAIGVLNRILRIDFDVPKNRKGAVARALGLQVNFDSEVFHLAVRLTFDRLREISTIDDRKRCKASCTPKTNIRCPHRVGAPGPSCANTFVFPYGSKRAAASAVADAFYYAGLSKTLTATNVDKIVHRTDLFWSLDNSGTKLS